MTDKTSGKNMDKITSVSKKADRYLDASRQEGGSHHQNKRQKS